MIASAEGRTKSKESISTREPQAQVGSEIGSNSCGGVGSWSAEFCWTIEYTASSMDKGMTMPWCPVPFIVLDGEGCWHVYRQVCLSLMARLEYAAMEKQGQYKLGRRSNSDLWIPLRILDECQI
jgi:hypothetical protein